MSFPIKPDENEKDQLKSLLFGNGVTDDDPTDDDIARWFQQDFQFCLSPSFGLRQQSGGPCGVLAAVEAEIIKYIYFDVFYGNNMESGLIYPDEDLNLIALAKAFQVILSRATTNNEIAIVESPLPVNDTFEDLKWTYKFIPNDDDSFGIIYEKIDMFRSRIGCLMFTLSLMMTRGLQNIRHDMDEVRSLVGRYGHTTQELINLLLTGEATSHPSDGELVIAEGLSLRGVRVRNSIGYLSHHEALGLGNVGDNYKYPEFPVWVVGGASHYSVLFSLDTSLNDLSSTSLLLHKLRKAFATKDPELSGMIPASALKDVLLSTDTAIAKDVAYSSYDYNRLHRFLKIEDDLIIWESFWISVSKLLSGQSLDDIIFSQGSKRPRSDSEVARDIQAALDRGDDVDNYWTDNSNSFPNRQRSDSEIARDLQATFDNNMTDTQVTEVFGNSVASTAATSSDTSNVTTKYRAITMYYFNGLEGPGKNPQFRSFTMKIELEEDKIGQLVSLRGVENVASNICPIEEVIRTRWPHSLLDWQGGLIPSID